MSNHRVLIARLLLASLLTAFVWQTAGGQLSSMRPSIAGDDSPVPHGGSYRSRVDADGSVVHEQEDSFSLPDGSSRARRTGSLLPGDPGGLSSYSSPGSRAVCSDPYGAGDPSGSAGSGLASGVPGAAGPRWYSDPDYVTQQGWSAYPCFGSGCYTWQLLPTGLLYKSYLAGLREPRLGTQWVWQRNHGWLWDSTLGARVGIVRYGTDDSLWPEGWQLDAEGAAFPRMDLEHERDLTSADFRAGTLLTMHRGPWESKFGYYHLSAHAGDEFLAANPDFQRVNYVRDCLVVGLGMRFHPDWRAYAEVGYGFYVDGGAEPWEFQFGAEYSPLAPTGARGAPFLAANAHLRQDVDFSGSITVQAGWQWRGESGHLTRLGVHYFNGMSEQREFFDQFEEQVGIGLWYDF